MSSYTIHAAKIHLSRLIECAIAGEDVVILRGRTPVARLTAINSSPAKRKFGAYRGEFEVPDAFFEPLPDAQLRAFEGEGHDADPLGHSPPALVDDGRRPNVSKSAPSNRRRKR